MTGIFKNKTTPCGKCYFSDSTVEDILTYIHYSDADVVFNTISGRYQYRQWVEPVEDVFYADPRPTITVIPRHGFYKFVTRYPGEPEVACKLVDIDKIEILI